MLDHGLRRCALAGVLASTAALVLAALAAALLGLVLTREAGGFAVFWPVNGLLAGVLPRKRPRLLRMTAPSSNARMICAALL